MYICTIQLTLQTRDRFGRVLHYDSTPADRCDNLRNQCDSFYRLTKDRGLDPQLIKSEKKDWRYYCLGVSQRVRVSMAIPRHPLAFGSD